MSDKPCDIHPGCALESGHRGPHEGPFKLEMFPVREPKKPGFWSKLGQSIGEAIGQAKFGS